MSGVFFGMTAGSIAGGGSYFLGSNALIVGGNNLSTTVDGTISDGGASGGRGGSLEGRHRNTDALRHQYLHGDDDGERRRAGRERLDRAVEPDHGEQRRRALWQRH